MSSPGLAVDGGAFGSWAQAAAAANSPNTPNNRTIVMIVLRARNRWRGTLPQRTGDWSGRLPLFYPDGARVRRQDPGRLAPCPTPVRPVRIAKIEPRPPHSESDPNVGRAALPGLPGQTP